MIVRTIRVGTWAIMAWCFPALWPPMACPVIPSAGRGTGSTSARLPLVAGFVMVVIVSLYDQYRK